MGGAGGIGGGIAGGTAQGEGSAGGLLLAVRSRKTAASIGPPGFSGSPPRQSLRQFWKIRPQGFLWLVSGAPILGVVRAASLTLLH